MRARLDIDFVGKRSSLGLPHLGGVLIGLIVLGLAVSHWSAARAQHLKAVQKLANTRIELDRVTDNSTVSPELSDPKRLKSINAAIMALNVPWAKTLHQIEQSRPENVALLRLEPRIQDRRIRVVAQADVADDLFAFVAALAADKVFPSVTPVRQERIVEEGKRDHVNLTFDVEWQL